MCILLDEVAVGHEAAVDRAVAVGRAVAVVRAVAAGREVAVGRETGAGREVADGPDEVRDVGHAVLRVTVITDRARPVRPPGWALRADEKAVEVIRHAHTPIK